MKVNEFINKLNELYEYQNTYRLGYFMNKTIDGKYLCDCSGLIKACLWRFPNGTYQSNNLPDINANTMISSSYSHSQNDNFYHLPTGAIVWMKGHIGVHIGYGVCMESAPKWDNKIQKTYIEGCGYPNAYGLPHSRKWTKWALLNCIDYSSSYNPYLQLLNDLKTELRNKLLVCGYTNEQATQIIKDLSKSEG